MAKVFAGIGTSHVPGIGAAVDNKKTQTDYWKPLFDGYEPVREWMRHADPDVAIIVYNDHASACRGFMDYSLELIAHAIDRMNNLFIRLKRTYLFTKIFDVTVD